MGMKSLRSNGRKTVCKQANKEFDVRNSYTVCCFCRRHGGLIVHLLDSRLNGPGPSPGWGYCGQKLANLLWDTLKFYYKCRTMPKHSFLFQQAEC